MASRTPKYSRLSPTVCRCIKVADFAVPVLHVVREVEVAAALEPGVLAGNEDEGPLPAATVMRLGGVGKINDDRVVQHRAIPFGHAFQFLHQVGHELEVKLVNLDLELTGAHVLEHPSVSDAVFANVNAKPGELHAEVGVTHPGGDGDGVSHPPIMAAAARSNWASSRSDSTSDLNLSVTSGATLRKVPSISPRRLWRLLMSS